MTATRTQTKYHVRFAIRRDVPELCRIDGDNAPLQWDESDFLDTLARRDCVGMVAERKADDAVVGLMVYRLHRDAVEVLNLAVPLSQRGKGVGTALLLNLAGKLSPARRTHLTATVPETALPALRFYTAFGFRTTGVARGAFGSVDGIEVKFVPVL